MRRSPPRPNSRRLMSTKQALAQTVSDSKQRLNSSEPRYENINSLHISSTTAPVGGALYSGWEICGIAGQSKGLSTEERRGLKFRIVRSHSSVGLPWGEVAPTGKVLSLKLRSTKSKAPRSPSFRSSIDSKALFPGQQNYLARNKRRM